MDTCHQPSAVSKRLLMADCRWLMAFLDKPGHEICAQKKMDVSSSMDDETRLRGSSSGNRALARQTMSSEFVSNCQRADGKTGLNQ